MKGFKVMEGWWHPSATFLIVRYYLFLLTYINLVFPSFCPKASEAVENGCAFLVLSDRAAGREHVPMR